MRPLFLALVPAGAAIAVLAYEVQADSLHTPEARILVQLAVGIAFLVAGLVAWWRRPANRLGALMVATGFAVLMRPAARFPVTACSRARGEGFLLLTKGNPACK